jgi:putative tricarboxylic transport membrane protein
MQLIGRARPLVIGALALMLVLDACSTGGGGSVDNYPTDTVHLMAPADPGGGWDSTARAMAPAIEAVSDAKAEVRNVGGAAGTIGLAQFVEQNKGDPYQLMVMGLVMSGGIVANKSKYSLDDITPIASLTTEQEAIVVPADSPYQTLEDLVKDWKADPPSIAWGGGSAGGTDQILVGLLAKEAGIDPKQMNYVANAGGGEAINSILSGAVQAGVSGVSEFEDQVESGQMRWLAVSGDKAPEGVDAKTIKDQGYDVVVENWRGVVGPPELSAEQTQAVVGLVKKMHDSDEWQKALKDNGWTDFFKTGDEFASYLKDEDQRVTQVLTDIGLAEASAS